LYVFYKKIRNEVLVFNVNTSGNDYQPNFSEYMKTAM
jgi:hypothetical protein